MPPSGWARARTGIEGSRSLIDESVRWCGPWLTAPRRPTTHNKTDRTGVEPDAQLRMSQHDVPATARRTRMAG